MAEAFTGRRAMGAIGSPVFLITSAFDDEKDISTINMVAGVSFSPPLVAVSLSHHSKTGQLAMQSKEFALHVISPEHMDIAKRIGSSSGHRIDKFNELNLASFEADVITSPLLEIAHTILECQVENVTDLGNHSLYVAKVAAYHDRGRNGPLYLYHGRYHSIGEELGSF